MPVWSGERLQLSAGGREERRREGEWLRKGGGEEGRRFFRLGGIEDECSRLCVPDEGSQGAYIMNKQMNKNIYLSQAKWQTLLKLKVPYSAEFTVLMFSRVSGLSVKSEKSEKPILYFFCVC